jgi:CBS domain-containing protein
MVTGAPIGSSRWTIREALEAMETADTDILPVVDGGLFIGVATTNDILKLDEILAEAEKGDRT